MITFNLFLFIVYALVYYLILVFLKRKLNNARKYFSWSIFLLAVFIFIIPGFLGTLLSLIMGPEFILVRIDWISSTLLGIYYLCLLVVLAILNALGFNRAHPLQSQMTTMQNTVHLSIAEKVLVVLIFLGTICFLFFSITEDMANKMREDGYNIELLDNLKKNVISLEEYKSKHGGIYPADINSYPYNDIFFYVGDPYGGRIYYKTTDDNKSYEMRFLGKDRIYGTEDDIVLP